MVTRKIVCPTLEATRTEPEFVAHITRTVDTDPDAEWIFVVDRLNTPLGKPGDVRRRTVWPTRRAGEKTIAGS